MKNLSERSVDAEPFVRATIDTFKTMVKLDVRRGEILLRCANTVKSDVSGMIGLTGNPEGRIRLGVSRPLALAIAKTFFGDTEVSDSNVADTVGELVNIITGFAKKDMPERSFSISLPTVVMGNEHQITERGEESCVMICLETPLGIIHLAVHLEDPEANLESAVGP